VSGRRKHRVLDDTGKAKLSYTLPCHNATASTNRLGPRTLSKPLLSLVAPSLLSPLSSRSEDCHRYRQVFKSVDHLGLWVKTANSLHAQVAETLFESLVPSPSSFLRCEQLLAGADFHSVHREVEALCPERTKFTFLLALLSVFFLPSHNDGWLFLLFGLVEAAFACSALYQSLSSMASTNLKSSSHIKASPAHLAQRFLLLPARRDMCAQGRTSCSASDSHA